MNATDRTRQQLTIGHDLLGSGLRHVVVLNDWLCDTSTWDGTRHLLDLDRFTFAFADLRGYGSSIARSGEFTLRESATDILGLADALDWSRFAIVGHSMSSLIALHLAQQYADRIEKAVVVTPALPAGFRVDDATLSGLRALANADDEARAKQLAPQSSHHR